MSRCTLTLSLPIVVARTASDWFSLGCRMTAAAKEDMVDDVTRLIARRQTDEDEKSRELGRTRQQVD